MPFKQASTFVAAVLVLSLSSVAWADDRQPTAEERMKIETSLRNAGYAIWEEIELDDGFWEVDDARKQDDPREFDLKLDPQTMEIVSEREDR